jgi:hypothetical protein
MADGTSPSVEQLQAEMRRYRQLYEAARADADRRDRALTEALEAQAATADILRVIASTSSDATRAFEAIAEHAYRLCAASSALVWLVEGDTLRRAAHVADASVLDEASPLPDTLPVSSGNIPGRSVLEGHVVHVEDTQAVPSQAEFPRAPSGATIPGPDWPSRSVVMVRPSGSWASDGRRPARSPRSRSACWRRSRTRPSSPSRTPGCSKS